jgi:hypothetical protein
MRNASYVSQVWNCSFVWFLSPCPGIHPGFDLGSCLGQGMKIKSVRGQKGAYYMRVPVDVFEKEACGHE